MFKVNRQALEKELALIQGAVEKKNTIPVLAYCLFEVAQGQAKITGTDLDVAISTSVAVDHDVDWEGCLPAKHLYGLVRLFTDEEVLFTVEKNERVKVHCGKAQHLLHYRERKDYPEIDKQSKASVVVVPATTFRDMLRSSIFVVSSNTNENRAHCLSLHLVAQDGALEVVGTDEKRVAATSFPLTTQTAFDCLLPRKAAATLISFLERGGNVQIQVSDRHAQFVCGEQKLLARLMDGKYINWKVIISAEEGFKARVSSSELALSIKRSLLTFEDRSFGKLKFGFKQSLLTISSTETVNSEATEPLSIETTSINGHAIGISGAQTLLLLSVLNSDECVMEFWEGERKPVRITPTQSDIEFQYFVAPVTL